MLPTRKHPLNTFCILPPFYDACKTLSLLFLVVSFEEDSLTLGGASTSFEGRLVDFFV